MVEDAACAVGACAHGAPVGSGALVAAWSLHPRKPAHHRRGRACSPPTTEEDWAVWLRRLREHGMNVSAADRHASAGPVFESYLETGFNYRMTDVQAAIGLVQLGKLTGMVARRRDLAARYHELLDGVPGVRAVRDPAYGTGNFQSFWVLLLDRDFPARPRRRAGLRLADGRGPPARRGIMASHLEPAYQGTAHIPLPVTERLTRDSLILPLFHTLTADQQEHIADVLCEPVLR